jgi:hypothetical protein
MTATDVNGNSKSGFATVTVQDLIAPIVNTKTANVYLDAAGNASVTATQVDNSSTDNCAIASRSVSPNTFTCANRGNNTVTLTVTDVNTNTNTGTATVNVLDTISPTISAANSTAIFYLGANGTAQVILNPFLVTSADNCGTPTITFSPSVISCTDIGIKTVTITATDASGNSKSIFTTAVVLDPILPVARPKARFTTYLSASGQALINASLLDSASSDNCTITSIVLSQSTFNCTNVGTNNVVFTVHDQSGNANAATVVVTVLDTILPVAIARNVSVQLNSLGTATITGAQVNNGSSDFCGIATLSVSPATFSCSNIGSNIITLTVTDNSGNIRTANAIATVADTVKPNVITRNITVSLNATGNVSITPADVNNGSSDACGIATMSVIPNTFTCANRGANTITLTITDNNGNVQSGTAIVTVQDNIKPTVITQNKKLENFRLAL